MKLLLTQAMAALALACLAPVPQAQAASFTLTGSFNQDDNVRLFSFHVANSSPVSLRTTSVATGGFDTILTLFSSTGAFLSQNDGPPGSLLPNDATIQQSLAPASYILALTEFDNFQLTGPGGNLSDGFQRAGQGNFTAALFGSNPSEKAFIDVTGAQRTSNFSLTFDNVSSASAVPEPATFAIFVLGLASLAGIRFGRRQSSNRS